MLTTKEISEMLSVSEETVRRWIRTGDLKAIQEGKSYLVEKEDLMKLIHQKASTTSSSIGKMASLLPLISGVGAIAGETIIKMITKKNLNESEKVAEKELSVKDINYHLESLKRKKRKMELEFQMKMLEIDEEILELQKFQDEISKRDK
ncbi:hypothetical protein BTO30_13810 [Domibacillus antri]|uniref:Helix-turn-helix domain-containing protein n=1 Tax=Domibacillus antri TaxID=1714264 RepID=A0A1Q8Q2S8_9BACI|nr:helix-turn-helix domain-containing protein [Domibacillus antri]OLN21637.1 hypothetical protein BTO30_13810 [Domibacillus antri]